MLVVTVLAAGRIIGLALPRLASYKIHSICFPPYTSFHVFLTLSLTMTFFSLYPEARTLASGLASGRMPSPFPFQIPVFALPIKRVRLNGEVN